MASNSSSRAGQLSPRQLMEPGATEEMSATVSTVAMGVPRAGTAMAVPRGQAPAAALEALVEHWATHQAASAEHGVGAAPALDERVGARAMAVVPRVALEAKANPPARAEVPVAMTLA